MSHTTFAKRTRINKYLHSPSTHRAFLKCDFVDLLTMKLKSQLLVYMNQMQQVYSKWGLIIVYIYCS